MSEILVNKLTGTSTAKTVTVTVGGSATQSLEQGLAKHFINFSMAGTSARDSLNFSSLTDTATGKFKCAVASAFNAVDYTATGNTNSYAGNSFSSVMSLGLAMGYLEHTTTVYDAVAWDGGSYVDATWNQIIIHGDLA